MPSIHNGGGKEMLMENYFAESIFKIHCHPGNKSITYRYFIDVVYSILRYSVTLLLQKLLLYLLPV